MAGPGPNPVFATMRHEMIMVTMRAEGRASVSELADQLSVTTETIRRDLVALERTGAIRRVHGGAVLTTAGNVATQVTTDVEPELWAAIVRRALEEVPQEGTILLGPGGGSRALARILPPDRQLTVVTNDLVVAQVLAAHDRYQVLVVGGRLSSSGDVLMGPTAEAAIAKFLVDVGFVEADGVGVTRGLTSDNEDDVALKAAVVAASRRTIALGESGAIGRELFQSFASADDVDLLITDSRADAVTVDALRGGGLHVSIAD